MDASLESLEVSDADAGCVSSVEMLPVSGWTVVEFDSIIAISQYWPVYPGAVEQLQ